MRAAVAHVSVSLGVSLASYLSDLLCSPLRGSPVKGPALLDDKVHGTHCLLNGGVNVRPVAENQVHIV